MKKNYIIIGLIFIIFFVISFLTNILGPLIPDIIDSFDLSLTLAAFLPFSFFVAYGVMSIPAGILVEKYGEKPVMIVAFLLALIGSFTFAVFPYFSVALPSLFIIGIGMAILQVAINPLLREAGGEEHFAFNSVLAQLVFGLASFISPLVFSYLVLNLGKDPQSNNFIIQLLTQVVPKELPWISLYWVFAIVVLFTIVIIAIVKFPSVVRKKDEVTGTWSTYKVLFKNKIVILYFFGIFAYVGTEQGVANWMSEFLFQYHGYDPKTVGAVTVSYFWGLLTAGCLLGLLLLKIWDSRKVLIFFSGAAIICLTGAIFGSNTMSLYLFPAVGFFASIMWSVIFSLALNSFNEHHGTFSGILVTGIIGGAVVPLVIGWVGDLFELRIGMMFLYLTLGYIMGIGFWANPLITNETFGSNKNGKVHTTKLSVP